MKYHIVMTGAKTMKQQAIAERKIAEYLAYAKVIGCQVVQDEMIVSSQDQMDRLTEWWRTNAQL